MSGNNQPTPNHVNGAAPVTPMADGNLRSAYELGRAQIRYIIPDSARAKPFVVLPKEHRIEDISPYLAPKRAAAHRFVDIGSFIQYAKDFRTAETRFFAKATERPEIRAEFDYLPLPPVVATPAAEVVGTVSHESLAPGERKHTATWAPKLAPEWEAWMGIEGRQQGQLEFAEFLDQWGYCCAMPDAMTMIELAQSLQATSTSAVKNAQRLRDGAGHLEHRVTIETSAGVDGKLSIPDGGLIRLPMFEGGPDVEVRFKLRIRLQGGALKIIVLYHKLLEVRRVAVGAHIDRVAQELGAPVYIEA